MHRSTRSAACAVGVLLCSMLIGCDRPSDGAAPSRGSGPLLADCALSMREVRPDGSLVDPPLIRPEHVARLTRRDVYAPTVLVQLTPEGAKRMERYTKRHVGAQLANSCGAREFSRATVASPFGGEFELSWPDAAH